MNIREEIIDAVKREIVGPCPNPNYIDDETREELLLANIHGSPKSRYGAGMLYPQQTGITEPDDTEGTIPTDEGADTEESKLIEERKR